MRYDEKAFKQRWPHLSEPGYIEHLKREYSALHKLSSYELCNLRAERNKQAAAARVFEPRRDRGDDGRFHFEDAKLRPMEVKSSPDVWDTVGFEMLRELWQEITEDERRKRVSRSLKEIHKQQGVEIQWFDLGGKTPEPVLIRV